MDAIYTRQSLDKKDSISIDTQIELCKKELSGSKNFRIYTDKGFSGKNTKRPEFQKMMAAVENGEIDRIIIYRLDRMSRSISDFAEIMNILEEHKVSFTSVNEKFDTSTPMGRAMLYIIVVFAQMERETIAERIRDNYYQRGKLGVWLGGPAPFGFTLDKTTLNEKKVSRLKPARELDIIKKLFDEYANTGKSLGMLAREMQKAFGDTYGIWNNIKLSRILHNPIYVKANADIYNHYKEKGCVLVNDIEEFDGTHGLALYGKRDRGANKYRSLTEHIASLSLTKGVIEPDIFLRCQYKLEKNKQIKNSGKGKHTWMSGLMKCAHCGYSLVVKSFKDKKYLYCSGRQNQHICPVDAETILLNEVENIAGEMVSSYLETVDRSGKINRSENDNHEANQLKIQIHKINEQIERLISSLAEADGSAVSYISNKINELDSKKQDLLAELDKYTAAKAPIRIPSPEEWMLADMEGKKELAQLIIDKILIAADKTDIIWKL